MKKNNIYVLLLLFSLIFLVSSTSAVHFAGEYSQQGGAYASKDSSYVINVLFPPHVKNGEDSAVVFSVYALTLKIQDNITVLCRFGLLSPQMDRLHFLNQSNFTFAENGEIWFGAIPGEFLYENGDYAFNVDCQDGTNGGYFNGYIEVTASGDELSTAQAIFYSLFIILFTILFIIIIYYIITLPWSNGTDESGILHIPKAKYIKVILIIPAHVCLLWILNLLMGISLNFLELEMYFGIIETLFYIVNYMSYPVVIIAFVYVMFEFLKDLEIQRNVEQLGQGGGTSPQF